MPTRCFTPIRGKRLRVVALDECGNVPASGTADSMIVSSGFVTVTLSAVVEDGVEIFQRRADGAICVNELSSPTFKRFTVGIEFCGVDPGLISLVTNAETYEDYAGVTNGFVIPEGSVDKKFALELWTGLSGAVCEPGADTASGYLLLPFVNAGVPGDLEISNDAAATFSMQNAFTKGGNAWGNGPFEVVRDDSNDPAVLPTALNPLDHLLMIDTGLGIPADACGLQPFIPAA